MMTAGVPIGSLDPWKQNSANDMYHACKSRSSPKPRAISSSQRYVRTWSQKEESYLLDARRARVPYKDIATRLNKTDLACRLHYHQMVVARKNSTSEQLSIPTPPTEQYQAAMQYHHHHRSESLPPLATAVSPQLLLPAAIMRDPSRNGSGALTLDPSHRRSISQPQSPDRRGSTPSPLTGGVAKHSPPSFPGRRQLLPAPSVDLNRIQELYRDFAPSFWSNIAAATGNKSLSPSDVENAFFHGQGLGLTNADLISPTSSIETNSLSTWSSAISPVSSATSHMTIDEKIRSPSDHTSEKRRSNKCSVNSLLND